MIKQIGSKIYYCNITGNVIKIICDMRGYIKETSKEEDFKIYSELKERNPNTVDLIQLEYGEYKKLSKESTGVKVDLENKKLIFTYDHLSKEPNEPTEIEKLNLKIDELTEAQKQQDKILLENSLKLAMLDIK